MIIKKINKRTAILLGFLLQTISLMQAQVVSPFNNLPLVDTSANYSFIVSGHFHGASYNASTFPAATLQANIDTLNALRPAFLMSLGDMFIDVNETYIEHYQKSLFDKLKMPLFNAVGNHDFSNENMYERVFGKSYFSFKNADETFIILNTELDDGSIKDEQLKFLTNSLNSALTEKLQNIFIFSHRPVWSENNEKYKNIFKGNTRTELGHNNYETEIKPLIEKFSGKMNIFWISGSLGDGPASFFYDKDPKTNITFMQTAIRDQERDAVLIVNVNNGRVSLKGMSFTGQSLDNIESYNIAYWRSNKLTSDGFNYRMIPYLIKQMFGYPAFWFGVVFACLLIIIFIVMIKIFRKIFKLN